MRAAPAKTSTIAPSRAQLKPRPGGSGVGQMGTLPAPSSKQGLSGELPAIEPGRDQRVVLDIGFAQPSGVEPRTSPETPHE